MLHAACFIVFDRLACSARYVRMYGTQRALAYGHSLFEFQIYLDAGTVTPTSTSTPTRTSTQTQGGPLDHHAYLPLMRG